MHANINSVLVVYVTCAGLDEAREIARAVIGERLAACANIRVHHAVYRWQGAVEEGEEAGLLLKTTREAYPALEARVRALSRYELPCIVAWSLVEGLADYLDWVVTEAAPSPPPAPRSPRRGR